MPVTVVGSIAFDSVKTPFGERSRMLGGAAVHFALAASFFDEVRVVGPVGDDFGEQQLDVLYGSTFRIGAYTVGYTRDVDLLRHVQTGVGANFSGYSLPDAIKIYYGSHPVGGNVFVRFRLRAAP